MEETRENFYNLFKYESLGHFGQWELISGTAIFFLMLMQNIFDYIYY